MPDPFSAAGAVKGQSRYSAATMNGEQFTGLITQLNPYANPAPYLVQKFYGGSRYDRIIDGLNREINTSLETQRSPGSSVWNANAFGPITSFYAWKYSQDGSEICRTFVDCPPPSGTYGTVFESTSGRKASFFSKTQGSGPTRFLGVSTELFFGDGVDQKKAIGTSKIWKPNTNYSAGDLILDPNGNLQQAFSAPLVLNILQVQYIMAMAPGGVTVYYAQLVLNGPMNFAAGDLYPVTLNGLTTATFLNAAVLANVASVGAAGDALIGRTTVIHANYGPAPDTGTATGITTQNNPITGYLGTSGAIQPTWATTQQALTADGSGLTWQCYGPPVKAWGVAAPITAPIVRPAYQSESYWQAGTTFLQFAPILDGNGSVEVCQTSGATGFIEPMWNTAIGGVTHDGTATWVNGGQLSAWTPGVLYLSNQCVLDSNGNVQLATTVTAPGTSGTAVPAWSTTVGATTADGANIVWTCCGPGVVLRSASLQFSFSWHSIDGTVSTAAPVNATVVNGILGTSGGFGLYIVGPNPASDGGLTADQISQIDQVWVWGTAQGRPTLIGLAQFPVQQTAGTWSVLWVQPDTALNAFIQAPVNLSGNPPPVGFRPMCYAFQRVWGAVDNIVYYSQGPDAVTGNGNTQFRPLANVPFLGTVYAIFPVTVQNGGLLVWTSSGIQIILGGGTATNPFYATTYYANVSVTGYNSVSQFNTSFFVLESNLKVSSVAVEYPFNPAGGYVELGLPIGDQFKKVTTGGINASLYNASSSFIGWNSEDTEENALYVADGAVGWFRLAAVSPPETGYMWAPFRQIVGGTSAVQAVETSPGVTQLLIGPPVGTTGPILVRDSTGTVWQDNGVSYPSWDVKGVNLLCSTGQWCEVAHISTKSLAVGARPVISVLLGEIKSSTQRPYIALEPSPDPDISHVSVPSLSVFSDRYRLLENGAPTTGDSLLTKFDYGTQPVGDALLDWGIYATVHDEREEPVNK